DWKAILEMGKLDLYLAGYRRALPQAGSGSEARRLLLDSFATGVLLAGATEYLPEADSYSAELLRDYPNDWTLRGTRGSVLIETGRIEEGMAMLREVMENDDSVFDRAISAAFLALGEIRRQRPAAARQWLVQARDLDPRCVA